MSLPNDLEFSDIAGGLGAVIDLQKPYLLVIFHPVTTHTGMRNEASELLEALHEINIPTIWLWPNVDAGSDRISTAIRSFRENKKPKWLYLAKHFQPEVFQKLLKNATCAIGNSSSFIRDSTFSGTPVVLTGDRQVGRERGENLIESEFTQEDLSKAINFQLAHGKYPISNLYGDGNASEKIVDVLRKFKPRIQKTISYIQD
jgi:UDP-N-acetylglucosamine 2-epimerase